MSTDNTERKQSGLIPFKPGQSGNPAGRPKGARNRLTEAVLEKVLASFERFGKAAIERLIIEDPGTYLRAVIALLPKHVKVEHPFADLTDDQLQARIDELNREIAAERGTPAGTGGTDDGAAPQATRH